MKSKTTKARSQERKELGSLAEFGPALFLFFVFIIVPLLSLIRYGLSTAAISFIVDRAAERACKSYSYDSARYKARETVYSLLNTPIARFSGLKPASVSDVRLSVEEHITSSDTTNVLTRDDLVRKSISPAVNTYEYELKGSYTLEPIVPGNLLGLGSVPFLSAPAKMTMRSIRPVEYPDGLSLPATTYSATQE